MPEIRLTKDGATAWLTIDHQERLNALTGDMLLQLDAGMDEIEADPEIRAVVLTGAGSKAFASGGDISKFGETRKNYDQTRAAGERRSAIFGRLGTLSKPTISMIRGYCMGGGMALSLQTDLRFAAEGSTFGIPAAKLGIAYGQDGIEKLVALTGPARARDILYSARKIGAEEAERMGLINKVLPFEALEGYVREYCEMLARNAPISIANSKLVIGEVLKPRDKRDHAAMEAMQKKAADSADFVEGRTAFMEKRRPVFRGA